MPATVTSLGASAVIHRHRVASREHRALDWIELCEGRPFFFLAAITLEPGKEWFYVHFAFLDVHLDE
jgi:hypothetical protein